MIHFCLVLKVAKLNLNKSLFSLNKTIYIYWKLRYNFKLKYQLYDFSNNLQYHKYQFICSFLNIE